MEALFSAMIAEIAATQDLPLEVDGGTCGFEYQGLEFLLEVPDNGALALFHAFLPLDECLAGAEALLKMNHDFLSATPSFFSHDPHGQSVLLTRIMPLSGISSNDLFQAIMEFATEARDVMNQITTSAESGGSFRPSEDWIRG